MNNKNLIIAIVVVIVVLAGGYGAYRLYNHYKRVSATPAPVAQMQHATPSPTAAAMAENNVYKTSQSPKLGEFFTDLKGMTLYTFAKDKPGVSNCTSTCLKLWPAFIATAGAMTSLPANVTVIKRTDGAEQYAYKGLPLYYYYLDTKSGDTLGQGVGGIWFVAKP